MFGRRLVRLLLLLGMLATVGVAACGEEEDGGGADVTTTVARTATRAPTTGAPRLSTPLPSATPTLTPSPTAEPSPTSGLADDLSPTPEPTTDASPALEPTTDASPALEPTIEPSPTSPGPEAPDPGFSQCPWVPEERSDATIIATSILSRESEELLFDSQEFTALREEVERILGLIRNSHPGAPSIHARERYVPRQMILGVESPLMEAISDAVASQPIGAELVTGQAAFDAVNAELGGVRFSGTEHIGEYSYVLLCIDELANLEAARMAYLDLQGVRSADPNGVAGDGPDIDALRDGNTWYVGFRDAWGDCPAGCMEGQLYYFTVTGDTVVAVGAAQAEADPNFAALARWVHGHEIVGIGVYWEWNPATGEFVILAPLLDSPAHQVGVRPGDVILAIDGEPVHGWTEGDVWRHLRGYEGREVTVGVRHIDGSAEDLTFVRGAETYHEPILLERIGVALLADTATGMIVVGQRPPYWQAEYTGIGYGDLILAVDGESTDSWTPRDALDRINGAEGEHMTVRVRHIDGAIEDITFPLPEACPTATYAGVVYLDGEVAPAGSVIQAWQEGRQWETTTTDATGHYEIFVPKPMSFIFCSPDGPLFFRMGNLEANERVDWQPGFYELNLTFSSAPR